MFAVLNGLEGMSHTCNRVSGGFDHALNALEFGQGRGVVHDAGLTRFVSLTQCFGAVLAFLPSHPVQGFTGFGHIQIGDTNHVIASDVFGLSEHHRTKFACTNDAYANRAFFSDTFLKQGCEIHGE